MAQTEMKLRLLRDRKIVGFMKIHQFPALDKKYDPATCHVLYSKTGKFKEEYKNIGLPNVFKELGEYDSFELGMNDWFEGDIFKVTYSILATKHEPYTQFIGVLKYLEMLGLWTISDIDNENEVDYQDQFNGEFDLEHIGNIHDNPELLKESNGK